MQHVAALLAEIVGTSAIDPSEPAAVLGIHHDREEQIAQDLPSGFGLSLASRAPGTAFITNQPDSNHSDLSGSHRGD